MIFEAAHRTYSCLLSIMWTNDFEVHLGLSILVYERIILSAVSRLL
jgi:hypothetical protein